MVPPEPEPPLKDRASRPAVARVSRESGGTAHDRPTIPILQEDAMSKRTKVLIAGAVVAATALVGGGAAVAGAGDDDGRSPAITGAALDRARAAALAEAGGGRVTGTEAGDEESYYEIEVTRPDGSRVDVQLDRSFRVVGREGERDDD
jgi:hypothetical protein